MFVASRPLKERLICSAEETVDPISEAKLAPLSSSPSSLDFRRLIWHLMETTSAFELSSGASAAFAWILSALLPAYS